MSKDTSHAKIGEIDTILKQAKDTIFYMVQSLSKQRELEEVDVWASKSCDCSCNAGGVSLENLDPVTQEKVDNITKELKVDTRNTSSHTRTLISASDPRPSAQAAGCVGIFLTLSEEAIKQLKSEACYCTVRKV
uniref:Uncharacterized protein n=1 Tax=Magallana gigas TaxID=29159 RepID=K1PP03_MAGGI